VGVIVYNCLAPLGEFFVFFHTLHVRCPAGSGQRQWKWVARVYISPAKD
jgi:hypothetical protein